MLFIECGLSSPGGEDYAASISVATRLAVLVTVALDPAEIKTIKYIFTKFL